MGLEGYVQHLSCWNKNTVHNLNIDSYYSTSYPTIASVLVCNPISVYKHLKSYYIDETSYLNACYLQGVKSTIKEFLKTVVSIPRFKQYIIENIQKMINNNLYFQRMQNLVMIDVTMKINKINHNLF